MTGLRGALAGALSDSVCTQLGTAAAAATVFAPISLAVAPEVTLPVAAAALGLSAGYGLFCDRPAPPLSTPPGFSGGQCAGVQYRVQGTYSAPNGMFPPTEGTFNRVGYGTVKGVVYGVDEGFRVGRALFGEAGSPGSTVIDQFASFGNRPENGAVTFTITSVTRIDGAPDLCGDPAPTPVIPNPLPPVDNRNVTYVNNEGDEVTNNYNFTFAPAFIDFNGHLTVPVTVNDTGDDTFNVQAQINFNTGVIDFHAGDPALPPGSGSPSPKGYKPDSNLPVPPAGVPIVLPPSVPTDTPPTKQEIIKGAIVTVSSTSPALSQIYQGDNPTIYTPNLGYINFLVQVGDATAWTSDIPIKNLRNFIPLAWDAGAIEVRGTPRPGVEWTITPIYVSQTVQ